MGRTFQKVATIVGIAALGFATAGMGIALLGGGTLFGAGSVFGMTTGLAALGGMSLGTIASIGALALSIGSLPGPPVDETGANDRGTAFADPDALGCYVFGTTTVQCAVVYEELTGTEPDRVLHDVFAHAWHRIESFDSLSIASDDGSELVTFSGNAATGDHANMLWWFRADGTQVAALSGAPFNDNSWPSTAHFEGVAHSGIVWNIDDDAFKEKYAAVPTKLDMVVEGAWLYDPREDTGAGGSGSQDFDDPTTWTFNNGNAILVLLRMMIGEYSGSELVWGRGIAEADYDVDNFMAMADVADETLDSKPRFRLGGLFMLNGSFEDFVARWEAETGGKLSKSGGIYRVWIPHDDLTSLTTITEDNLLAGGAVTHSAGGIDGLYNTARGRYIEPTEGYRAFPYPQVEESSAITEDGGRRILFHDFSWVQDVSIAERVARIKVRRSRFQRIWTIPIGWAGFGPNYKPFTVHTLNVKETGNDAQLVRVVGRALDPMTGVAVLTLQQEDESIYDDTIALGDPHASDTIPSRISPYRTITPRYVDGSIITPDWTPNLVNITRDSVATFTKTGGSNNTFDASVYSSEGYSRCAVTFKASQTNKNVDVGLNTNPSAAHDRNNIDYAIIAGSDGNIWRGIGGSVTSFSVAYSNTDLIALVYDGVMMRWYKNSTLLYAEAVPTANAIYHLDSSFYESGAAIYELRFFPVTSKGTNEIDPNAATTTYYASDASETHTVGASSNSSQTILSVTVDSPDTSSYIEVTASFQHEFSPLSPTADFYNELRVGRSSATTSYGERFLREDVDNDTGATREISMSYTFQAQAGSQTVSLVSYLQSVIGVTAAFRNVNLTATLVKR